MFPATVNSMEEMDPAREKEARLVDVVRGPLSASVEALERRNAELPTGQDFHFYNNFQEFKRPVADIRSRAVALLSQLGSLKDVIPHPSEFPADVDEGYDWLVGMQDTVLERVDASLDKFYLERKAEFKQRPGASSTQNPSVKSPRSVASESTKSGDVKMARNSEKMRSPIPFHIPSIPRPQDKFDDQVDNSNTPFRHKAVKGRIQIKSAATTSQETGPVSEPSSVISNLSAIEAHARKLGHMDPAENIHPLQEELAEMAYVDELSDKVEVRKYGSLDDTPFTFVTTPKALKKMAAKLQAAGEVAIDLENHHYRSYQGFVCLMQLSTRDEDFIVDTLDLRSEIGPCLGDIFGDPAIRKVMHGADRDIVWLQRDFGIYVCNLFDTGQAARVLELQGFGLGFLLEHFCGVHADKRYQLADWRIRPLPSEMTKYAREDTHYLLYLHDMLKQLLLDARASKKADEDDLLLQVHKRSRDLCLQLYAKDIFTETSYQHLYGLHEKKFGPEQLAVLAALYSWRDSIARREDESTGYVMPNHLLLQLATEMPDDVRQLQSFVKGSHSYVSRNTTTVIEIIRQSKEKALKELQESQRELEEGELAGGCLREEVVSDEIDIEGNRVSTALKTKQTVLEAASKSEDHDGNMETSFSKKLQIDNLITPVEAGTSVTMPGSNIPASETLGSDKAGDSLTDARSGEGQPKLKSEILRGPVVVSRRASSSLFGRKLVKTPSVHILPSNVPVPEEPSGISAAQDSPATIMKDPDSSLYTTVQVTSDTFTADDGNSKSLDGGQRSELAQEIAMSTTTLAAGIEVASKEIQTAGAMSSATMEAVDRARDIPFTVPETSAFAVIESVSESTSITVAKKKPSKLGSLLGGRKRVHQAISSESAMDAQQVKIKTHDIESSMVLPFGTPVVSLPDISIANAQQPFQGEVKAITAVEERTDDFNRNLQETARSDEETPERPACSIATQLPAVIMLEADEVGRRTGPNSSQAVRGGQNTEKHRTWWPPVADKSGHRGSDSARDASPDQRDGDRSPKIPMSLSEMHRNSKREKKRRLHSELSFDTINGPGGDFASVGSSSRKKKRRKERSLVPEVDAEVKRVSSTEHKLDFKSFNYREARDVLRLENMYTEKADDIQGSKGRGRGRGRGSKKGSDSSGIPLSRTAFDPLRRAREDPRPEGIRPGQRRQVFPQTGNRTAAFKQ